MQDSAPSPSTSPADCARPPRSAHTPPSQLPSDSPPSTTPMMAVQEYSETPM